ncbi:hypothetical protein MAXJ12_23627 [Mesorhizobium alhagi CCNWXJ12-2]|uniref:Uncharacterized protein n=1 Tax=Mesorhizobium alhagi CCNWXJ12-2 TaxID=1107882 RepID=H0HX08_9HYPH|nr:hypothetical protein MAXJ12_23627 [Mesorhizobium alhagi CCNWXJ12-2]
MPLRSAGGSCTVSESAAPIAAVAQHGRDVRGVCPILVLVNRLQKEHPA